MKEINKKGKIRRFWPLVSYFCDPNNYIIKLTVTNSDVNLYIEVQVLLEFVIKGLTGFKKWDFLNYDYFVMK